MKKVIKTKTLKTGLKIKHEFNGKVTIILIDKKK